MKFIKETHSPKRYSYPRGVMGSLKGDELAVLKWRVAQMKATRKSRKDKYLKAMERILQECLER
jgi:hypothetical protein